jgi:hypothetical protein
MSLHRLVAAEKAAPPPRAKARVELESHAATTQGVSSASKTKTKETFDKKESLPNKSGKLDQTLYDSFPPKSLRRRLWDAVVAGHCPRCSGPHLRVACPKPRQVWEDDFEKEDFFTKPPPPVKKQIRVQLATNSSLPSPAILAVVCPFGRCLIDTCSDVSVARLDVITDVRAVRHPVMVEHMGRETVLSEAGTLELRSFSGAPSTFLRDVHVVAPELLPAGVVALLGVADIRALNLSLDAVIDNPDCIWERAVRRPWFWRARHSAAGWIRRWCAPGQDRAIDETVPAVSAARVPPPHPMPQMERVPKHAEDPSAGEMLLAETRRRVAAEQEQRAALRIAGLMRTAQTRKRVTKKKEPATPPSDNLDWIFTGQHLRSANLPAQESSSVSTPPRPGPKAFGPWPRKRSKFYAVRRGRATGIFTTWEECERQVKGIYSEFKSFYSLEEAQEYLSARRRNYMIVAKPASSFVRDRALRAEINVWQDGHADALRTVCGLDTMSDVNMTLVELLHEVHEIDADDVRGCGGATAFTHEGILKVLQNGEVVCVPALVAKAAQLPRLCDVSLGVPGLDRLGVCVDQHRTRQR